MLILKKFKYMVMAISAIIAVVFLVACSPNTNDTSIEMNDRNFSGIETHTITLRANDVIRLNTMGNTFSILIVDESGTPTLFSGDGINGRDLRATVIEDGEYTITIEGSGRFRISW